MHSQVFLIFIIVNVLNVLEIHRLFFLIWAAKFYQSTKPAPLGFAFVAETRQYRPSPAPGGLFPHPLQNRVPRVQVLLPLPKNRRKHWVFAGSLFFMCCIAIWCILVQISGFPTRPHRLHPSPAPGTHPVSHFSGFSGCVSLFLPSFDLQNFRLRFCAFCRVGVTS